MIPKLQIIYFLLCTESGTTNKSGRNTVGRVIFQDDLIRVVPTMQKNRDSLLPNLSDQHHRLAIVPIDWHKTLHSLADE
jgi:hypothetical protein